MRSLRIVGSVVFHSLPKKKNGGTSSALSVGFTTKIDE
jgi:hypothetical protein